MPLTSISFGQFDSFCCHFYRQYSDPCHPWYLQWRNGPLRASIAVDYCQNTPMSATIFSISTSAALCAAIGINSPAQNQFASTTDTTTACLMRKRCCQWTCFEIDGSLVDRRRVKLIRSMIRENIWHRSTYHYDLKAPPTLASTQTIANGAS